MQNDNACSLLGNSELDRVLFTVISVIGVATFSLVALLYIFVFLSRLFWWQKGSSHPLHILALFFLTAFGCSAVCRFLGWHTAASSNFGDMLASICNFLYNLGVASVLAYFVCILGKMEALLVPSLFALAGLGSFVSFWLMGVGDHIWVSVANNVINLLCLSLLVWLFGRHGAVFSGTQRKIVSTLSFLVGRELFYILAVGLVTLTGIGGSGDKQLSVLDAFSDVILLLMLQALPLVILLGALGEAFGDEPPTCNRHLMARLALTFNGRKYCVLMAYYLIVSLLFAWGANQGCGSDFGNIFQWKAVLARGSASALLISPFLLTAGLQWVLPRSLQQFLGNCLPLGYMDTLHRHLAWTTLAMVALHAGCHFAIIYDLHGLDQAGLSWSNLAYPWVTGWIAAALIGISGIAHRQLVPSNLPFGTSTALYTLFADNSFEISYWGHRLGALFVIPAAIHGAFGTLGFPLFWVGTLVTLLLLLVDMIYCRRARAVVPFTNKQNGTFSELTIILPSGKTGDVDAGGYIRVKCPAISAWQWHPFTISTVSGAHRLITLVVENQGKGTWTDSLQAIPTGQLVIEGPFSSPLSRALAADIDGFVLFAGGKGFTTSIAAIRYLVETHDPRPWTLIVSLDKTSQVHILEHHIGHALVENPSTIYWTAKDSQGGYDQQALAETNHHFTHVKYGRPHPSSFFEDMTAFAKNLVVVGEISGPPEFHAFCCGPERLKEIAECATRKAAHGQYSFEFHGE